MEINAIKRFISHTSHNLEFVFIEFSINAAKYTRVIEKTRHPALRDPTKCVCFLSSPT